MLPLNLIESWHVSLHRVVELRPYREQSWVAINLLCYIRKGHRDMLHAIFQVTAVVSTPKVLNYIQYDWQILPLRNRISGTHEWMQMHTGENENLQWNYVDMILAFIWHASEIGFSACRHRFQIRSGGSHWGGVCHSPLPSMCNSARHHSVLHIQFPVFKSDTQVLFSLSPYQTEYDNVTWELLDEKISVVPSGFFLLRWWIER